MSPSSSVDASVVEDGTSPEDSTRPSSPPLQTSNAGHVDDDVKKEETEKAQVTADGDDVESEQVKEGEEGENEDGDDLEGMDMKAKALTNLLRTSSVFVAIMAEKMRDQQKKLRETAQKKAAKEKTKGTTAPAGKQNDAEQPKNAAAAAATKGKGDITNYLDKAELDIPENNESVQAALAKAADEFEQKPSVLGEQNLIATQQPALVTGGQMREYQLEGLEWLKSLWMNGLCGILADEMGLGKTVQAISLIAFFKEHKISGPFLIVSPLSTVSNWVDEFARWTPTIKTVLYHGGREERAAIRRRQMRMQAQRKYDFPVVCTSYEICMNDRKFLSKYQWKYIIVDEGHRLKNFNCRLIKELLTYNSANRLLMTGTPLQNNIAELWSLLHFLLPDIFNDLNSFENWFDFSSVLDSSGQKQRVERRKNNLVSTMHAILKPFLLRRVKTDVETSLPKKREYILYAPLTPEQKDLYLEIRNGTSRQYLEQKAVERLEKKKRLSSRLAQDLKRKAGPDEVSSANGSPRSSRSATPAAAKRPRLSYKPMGDREFMERLKRMEMGEEVTDEEQEDEPDELEQLEIERKKTMQLAKKEIGAKKLQNPVMQARLACNSPHNFYWPWDDDQIDNTLVTCSGKMLLLERLVPHLMKKGHKILIFSQFKTQLDILQDWATQLHAWNCCRIDGGVAQVDRRELIRAFNTDPSYKIFLLSTRAGGQGINLTAADTVILYDSDWNPQQDLQAQDRAHRIGQTKPVVVYRLATKNTIEQTLLEKADSKRRLEKLVIQKGKFKSLLDGGNTAPEGGDEFRQALGEEEGFEIIDVGDGTTSEALLSDKDLETITNRSDEAYERAEKGLEEGGEAFKVVETKRGSETVS